MKIITRTKLKLPRWVISRLPLGEEEQEISSMVVPMILFSIMAIGEIWHQFYVQSWVFLLIVLTILVLLLVFGISWWLFVQVDVLMALRKRYALHYEITQNQEEKLEIKRKLEDLCVDVETLVKA